MLSRISLLCKFPLPASLHHCPEDASLWHMGAYPFRCLAGPSVPDMPLMDFYRPRCPSQACALGAPCLPNRQHSAYQRKGCVPTGERAPRTYRREPHVPTERAHVPTGESPTYLPERAHVPTGETHVPTGESPRTYWREPTYWRRQHLTSVLKGLRRCRLFRRLEEDTDNRVSYDCESILRHPHDSISHIHPHPHPARDTEPFNICGRDSVTLPIHNLTKHGRVTRTCIDHAQRNRLRWDAVQRPLWAKVPSPTNSALVINQRRIPSRAPAPRSSKSAMDPLPGLNASGRRQAHLKTVSKCQRILSQAAHRPRDGTGTTRSGFTRQCDFTTSRSPMAPRPNAIYLVSASPGRCSTMRQCGPQTTPTSKPSRRPSFYDRQLQNLRRTATSRRAPRSAMPTIASWQARHRGMVLKGQNTCTKSISPTRLGLSGQGRYDATTAPTASPTAPALHAWPQSPHRVYHLQAAAWR